MAAIPISGLRSAWDVFATLFVVFTIARWRFDASVSPWGWLSCAALASLAFSAFANGQSVASIFGALVSIGSMIGTLIFIQRLYGRNSRHGLISAASLAAGVTFHAVLFPSASIGVNPWKYGVGFGVAIVLLAVAATTGKSSLELSALAMLGALSLATGTRGLTSTLAIASVIVISRGLTRQRSLAVRITATMVIVVAALTLGLTLGSRLVNSNLADSARDRFLQQAAINSNPILAGRIEPPISISAAITHPLIGAGANPKPTREIVSRALHIADVMGYKNPKTLVLWWTQKNQIYTHSLIMEYWVVGGVLAALPFMAAFGVLGVGLVRSLRRRRNVPALAIFLALQSLSDLIFAPEAFGSASYVGLSVGIVLAALLMRTEGEHSTRKRTVPLREVGIGRSRARRPNRVHRHPISARPLT